jgi:hypothetical protein
MNVKSDLAVRIFLSTLIKMALTRTWKVGAKINLAFLNFV